MLRFDRIMNDLRLVLLCVIGMIGFSSCKDDVKDPDTFNRSEMLSYYADNLIVPGYTATETAVVELQTAVNTFLADRNATTLQLAQEKWTSAFLAFKRVNAYNFGPAGEDGLRKSLQEEVATFPISDTKMQNILNGAAYNLNDFNRDARGFLAIEYLIFSQTLSNEELLASFDSAQKRDFLVALTADVLSRISTVKQAWTSSYRSSFVSNNGTDAGSSTSLLYNEFVKSYENLKNFQLGLPCGLRPGQTGVAPNLVEAFSSGQSITFIKAQLNSLENIWRGGSDEKGFKKYLMSVTGGPALVSTTEAALGMVRQKMDVLLESIPMQQQLIDNPQPIIDLHTEIQKNTKNYKSDLSSLIGIAITYSSGDGD
jgi:uncharacterized protein